MIGIISSLDRIKLYGPLDAAAAVVSDCNYEAGYINLKI